MKKLLTLIVLIYIKFTTYAQNLQEAKIKYKESENNDRLNQVEAIPSLKKLEFNKQREPVDINFEKLKNDTISLNKTNTVQALKNFNVQLERSRNDSTKANRELDRLIEERRRLANKQSENKKKIKDFLTKIDTLNSLIKQKDIEINDKNSEINKLLENIVELKREIIQKDSILSKNILERVAEAFLKKYNELDNERVKIAGGLNKFSEDLSIDKLNTEENFQILSYRDSLYFRYFRTYLAQKDSLVNTNMKIITLKNHIEEYLLKINPKLIKNATDLEIITLRLNSEYEKVLKCLEKNQNDYIRFGENIKNTNEKITEMKKKYSTTKEEKDLAAVVNINSLLGQRSLIPSTTVLGNRKFQFINSDWYGEVKLFTAAMTNQNLRLSNLFIPEASNLGFTINTTTLPSKDKNTGIFFSFNYLGKNLYGIDSTKNKADTTLFNMGVIHTKIGLQRILVANDILSIYANQNYILPIDNIKVFDKFYRTEKSSLHSIIRYFDVGIKALLSSSKTSAKLMIDVGFIINNSDTKSITGSVDRAIPNLKVSVYTAF
ncbi:hypothetical protein Emtol_2862 [Emticicia oligotrophica DSM 17448]|uniref:Uncharacterized protein n=1 Tax=Emticicia oligotrophica (strain DSM 17448 / CIP 109782 / MTCC 6937 / GPTSA100-15) TaxID=929562 RepID=A0ABN4ANT0_EMTOG|nr:hypothetical protein [Emticicia oligotrophica]AFK03995.1 hypothetical protein Emtol_2862 [Emticicia oligotrophica DSM 17448]